MSLPMGKTVFFDFGGCLDAPGIHTRTLFWDAFEAEGLVGFASLGEFQEGYSLADRQMMRTGEAKELSLEPFNRWNAALIAKLLTWEERAAERAADRVSDQMKSHLVQSREAIAPLRDQFQLGVISNFTGNLEIILREFRLHELFSHVTESFYVGCAKPDLRMFHTALGKQQNPPRDCIFVGDNPVNDIAPAKALGMKTILIHQPGQKRECGATAYVDSLGDLGSIIQSI